MITEEQALGLAREFAAAHGGEFEMEPIPGGWVVITHSDPPRIGNPPAVIDGTTGHITTYPTFMTLGEILAAHAARTL